uniref:Uncharacterized protein n=1 Tax=Nelumbo nucifera TaxID=4432 RepID=A0A822ZI63_NELNU|nr:TPA_asm: hypothetical protein HUJ06_002797 [Nelumbo nucifera]
MKFAIVLKESNSPNHENKVNRTFIKSQKRVKSFKRRKHGLNQS